MSSYPAGLPGPTKVGHAPKPRNFVSDLEGPVSYSNRERDFVGTAEIEFFFTAEQSAVFYSWWRDDLLYGGRWFNCEWPSLRSGAMVAQFLTEPSFEHIYQGAHRISVSVDIRGASRPVISCVADYYYRGIGRDPFVSNVALAVLFNDAHDSSTAVSRLGPAVTRFGSAVVSNEQMHFGANTYKNTTSNSASSFRTGGVVSIPAAADFCIEAWAYLDGTGGYRHVVQVGSSLTNRANIAVSGGALKGYLEGTSITVLTSGAAFPSGQWVHTALAKQGSVLRLFQGGLVVASAACGALSATSAAFVSVGTQNFSTAAEDQWVGYLDDCRVTVGVSRFSDSALPDLQPLIFEGQFTVLSLHGESLLDSSSEPKTLTNNGVAVSDVDSRFGGGALLFAGSQYLACGSYSDYSMLGDFTLEFWAKEVSGNNCWWSTSTANTPYFYNGEVKNILGTGVHLSYGSATIAAWTQFLVVRSGSMVCVFRDGALVSSGAYAGTLDFSGLELGRYKPSTNLYLVGYIDDLRLTKGVAREVPRFASPTAAHGNSLSADSLYGSVVLLMHGDTSFADSSSYARAVNATGAASISTAQSKFGGASMYLSSIAFGAYLVDCANSADFSISSSNFTIEMWAYELEGSLGSLLSHRAGGTAAGWAYTVAGLRAKINGTWSDTQMVWTRPTQNAWHHHALVRVGSAILAFVDGVLVGMKGGVTSIDDVATILRFGSADNASENKFLGYMDDLRFTKAARYLQSFTPPTLTFCDHD